MTARVFWRQVQHGPSRLRTIQRCTKGFGALAILARLVAKNDEAERSSAGTAVLCPYNGEDSGLKAGGAMYRAPTAGRPLTRACDHTKWVGGAVLAWAQYAPVSERALMMGTFGEASCASEVFH
jgi:hypothetical protein